MELKVPAVCPDPQSSVQQAHGVSTNQGSVNLAGRDVHQHTHYHIPSQKPTIDMEEVLRLVPNLRKIHLDILSKATPGTAIWIFKTGYWLLWLKVNGGLKILWGTGIRG